MAKSSDGAAVRIDVVRPLGLMTTPNPNGQYPPGAMSIADGLVLRKAGTLATCPGLQNTVTLSGANNDDLIRLLMPLSAGHVYAFNHTTGNVWTVWENANTAALPSIVTGGTALFSQARVQATRSRDRMIVNSLRGCMVGDSMAPSNSTERALRVAGLPQPSIFPINFAFPTNGPIPAGVTIGYSALITREFADGYIVKSVPAPAIRYNNVGVNTLQLTIRISWINAGVVKAGDFVEIYRTDGLATASPDADPGSTMKLVSRVQLTATDITNALIDIVDRQAMTAPFYTTTGRELYTNPYQEGSLGSNRQPDTCQSLATYKGFTFYGNLTERAQVVLSVPGSVFGSALSRNAYRRANGIGARLTNGTSTLGNPTITAVPVADIVGIVAGQYWFDGSGIFAIGTRVVSVGATSITMNANALVGGAFTDKIIVDIIELDGVTFPISGAATIGVSPVYETSNNQSVSYDSGATSDGLVTVVEQAVVYGSIAGSQNITVRGTRGAFYSPPIPEFNATVQTFSPVTTKNLMRWSKDSEPEHVPSSNETQVGTGTIIAFVSTKDALWIFCTDGIYRLSGDGGVWRIDQVAPGCILCGPRCATNLKEVVYAYTNYGLVAVVDSGIVPISDQIVRGSFPGPPFAETADLLIGRMDIESEVLFSASSAVAQTIIFNTTTKAFTTNGFIQVTAFAYQDQPTSGLARLLIARANTGSKPEYAEWQQFSTSYVQPQANFRPIDDGHPMLNKQWIDVTYMFRSEAAGLTLIGSADGVTQGTGIVTGRQDGEAAINIGLDRAHAIRTKLSPGFVLLTPITATTNFYGFSARYVPLTAQQEFRG